VVVDFGVGVVDSDVGVGYYDATKVGY